MWYNDSIVIQSELIYVHYLSIELLIDWCHYCLRGNLAVNTFNYNIIGHYLLSVWYFFVSDSKLIKKHPNVIFIDYRIKQWKEKDKKWHIIIIFSKT